MPATTQTTSNSKSHFPSPSKPLHSHCPDYLSPNYIPKTSLDKETRSTSDSRRPSEIPEWLAVDYRPTEFHSRSSSVNSRSRSTSGSWDTHRLSAEERQWRKDQEAKSRNAVKKLFSYGFMEGK